MPTRPIRDILRNQKLVTATPGMSVREAARLMAREKKGALPVVESGRLVGIFTERDALARVLAAGLDADAVKLSEVMTRDPRTVAADRPLNHALHMMFEGGFRHIPVVDGGRVIGVVSARDALGPEMTQFEKELNQRDDLAERM
ncbi:MAG: CBS domain-containing protein [Burkholderiales bacterium]